VAVSYKKGLCPGQSEPCIKEAGRASGMLLLHISKPATATQLVALLAPYQRYQRIHINHPHEVFARFDVASEAQQYDALSERLTVEWGCRREDERGALSKRHMVLMRPWVSRKYEKLCNMVTLDGKPVTRWC
jgi:hypothetical protein